jgi:hypothetical protein
MDPIAAALERAHPVWNKDSRIGLRFVPAWPAASVDSGLRTPS